MQDNNEDISNHLEEIREIITMLATRMEKQKKEAFQKGKKEGMHKKALQIAKALLKENMSIEKISSITDLPVEEIEVLKPK